MAYEAVKIEGPYEVHDFTVSTSATISAATLCVLTDPRTAAASPATAATDAAPLAWAGIAATEHTAGKGKTELGLYTKGVFKLTASSPVAAGHLVRISGANLIADAGTVVPILSGAVVGKALQDIAGNASGEVFVGAV